MDYIICHYAEIGLKGKNRRFFEERLIENIKMALKRGSFEFVKRISGRILIKLSTEWAEKAEREKGEVDKIKTALKSVFGIANFSFTGDVPLKATGKITGEHPLKVDAIGEKAMEILKDKKFKTFKVASQRSDKNFPLTSQQINEQVGAFILEKFPAKSGTPPFGGGKIQNSKIKVDLESPDVILYIEVVEKQAFLYTDKIKGPGGLPLGTGGKAVALISGGIDSPVAAYLAMKRGVEIIFLHFHSYPYTNKASIEKVEKLVGHLSRYQKKPKLYLAPFGDIQKEILLKTPAKLRVVLYRRMMLRIAQALAEKEKALALITGESIGQVASQTLENMAAIQEVCVLPILRPLVGWDKEEIIKAARDIGSFDISSLPDQDCCSRFVPEHPETKAKMAEVKAAEKKLNIRKLFASANPQA